MPRVILWMMRKFSRENFCLSVYPSWNIGNCFTYLGSENFLLNNFPHCYRGFTSYFIKGSRKLWFYEVIDFIILRFLTRLEFINFSLKFLYEIFDKVFFVFKVFRNILFYILANLMNKFTYSNSLNLPHITWNRKFVKLFS